MATDADEATNALIARMLAEEYENDDPYGGGELPYTRSLPFPRSLLKAEATNARPDTPNDTAFFDDSSDDDFGTSRRGKTKRKASKGPKVGRPRKTPKPEIPPGELTASGRRKRKDTGTKRPPARAWTESEERLFWEALALHGRNWKACAAHVGTRDSKSFTSHAQKHNT